LRSRQNFFLLKLDALSRTSAPTNHFNMPALALDKRFQKKFWFLRRAKKPDSIESRLAAARSHAESDKIAAGKITVRYFT